MESLSERFNILKSEQRDVRDALAALITAGASAGVPEMVVAKVDAVEASVTEFSISITRISAERESLAPGILLSGLHLAGTLMLCVYCLLLFNLSCRLWIRITL